MTHHHYWSPRVSTPPDSPKDWRSPVEEEMSLRERDRLFVRELAKAFQRGDHLPAGVSRPLVLFG